LDRIKIALGCIAQDIVDISPETPNLDALLNKFDQEHFHPEEEIRLVLEGRGVFDVRSNDDCWIRVEVSPFDYIAISAHRHHRFFAMDDKALRCVRLFKSAAGFAPRYRRHAEVAVA
jgi:1,2-dihydroxy-3-keto-5-methylthiopentene dioxygenase